MTTTPDPRRLIGRRDVLRTVAVLGGAAAVGGAAAACGKGTSSTGGTPGGGSSGGGGGSTTVRLGILADINNFDPFQHQLVNFPILRTCYDYLAQYDSNHTLHPQLASSWKMADDHMSSTITLTTATFQSGKPVTAQDVVAGINRALNPDTGNDLNGGVGFIKSATAVDDKTVKLVHTTATPMGLFTDLLNGFPVVEGSAQTGGGSALKSKPAGSGPFMLDSYRAGVKLVLKKNPHYFMPGKPYLDSVEFQIFGDADSMFSALQTKAIDGGMNFTPDYKARIDSAGLSTVVGAQGALVDLLFLTTTIPPFTDVNVRRAVARAIDRDKIIAQLRKGVAEPLYDIFPPGSPGYDSSLLKKVGFDLPAAKALLAKSSQPKASVAFVQPNPQVGQAMQIIQADLASIGFSLKIEQMDQATWQAKTSAGQAPVSFSASAFSGLAVAGIANGPQLSTNSANTYFPKGKVPASYVSAIDAARTALTPTAVNASVAKINDAFFDLAWANGVATRPPVFGFQTNVTGFAQAVGAEMILTTMKKG